MAEWIEFGAIKRTVPLLAVLAHYRIGELRRSGKSRLRGRCPLHAGEGRETFHADTTAQVFHCFSCGAGGSVLDLVAAMEHCSVRQAAEKLWGWKGRWAPADHGWQPTVTKKIESVPRLGFHLWGVDPQHPYLGARGIGEATAAKFGVGYYAGPRIDAASAGDPDSRRGWWISGVLWAFVGRQRTALQIPGGLRQIAVAV